MKKLVACSMICAFVLGASVAATNSPKDTLTVPIATNFVAQGETATWSEDTSLTPDTTLQKTGGGKLVVPASQTGLPAFKLDAAEGAIEFQNDLATATADELTLSDAIKAKLALWVSLKDKAHIVPVTEGGAEIERWYDVRETDIANPKYVYLQAEHTDGKPGPSIANPLFVRKCSTETNTLELVSFGGYSSGISMKFLNPNGTAYTKRPMEMSTVYGYTTLGATFGFLCGHCKETSEHRLWNEETGLPWQSVWASVAGDTRIWVDGKTVDRSIGTLPYGFHVLHTRVNTFSTGEELNGTFEDALFSNGKSAGTKGGQYVGEVMFFTARLTAAERRQVQNYLDRKWFGRRVPTTQVTLESGAELDVVADDTTEIDLQAAGDGAFVKKGDGTLVYRPKAFANGPSAAATIEGGAIEATRAISVAATAGMTVSSAIPTTLNGEMLTTGDAEKAGAVEKIGLGSAAISTIPEGTKTVRVNEGTLALRPAKAPVRRYEVAIPNGDFSDWGGDTTHGNVYAEYGGWSCSGATGFCHYDRWFTTGGAPFSSSVLITAFGYDVCPPPEGKCFLMMKVVGSTAKVGGLVIPEAGEYELSCLMTTRDATSQRSRVKVYLTDAAANEIYCGTYASDTIKTWEQKSLRFSVPVAGTYTLHLDHQKWYDGKGGRDAAVLFNALHLYRIGDRANAWKIPNGDFEDPSGDTMAAAGGRIDYIDGSATIAGWEFDNTNTGNYGEHPMMRSGLTDNRTYCEGGRRWGSGFNNSQWPLGGIRQALIRRDGGWVKATFTPPKGKWYLKADMALWGEYSTANGGPQLKAEVTGGVTADLGAIAVPKNWTMQPQIWATPFEADGETEVTLTLTFQSTTGLRGVNLDDFELVGEYEHPYEIVQNGDFELPIESNGGTSARTGWTKVTTTKFSVTNETTGAGKTTTLGDNIPREYGRDNWAFGTDYGSGDYFMEPYNSGGGVGGFYQAVTFPHAGWYRLSYLVKSRYNASQNDRLVEVDLIDADNGVTNRIDSIHRMTRGVYCQRTALFHLDGACTRNLAFLCPVQSGDYPAFDDVSVRFLGETYEAALATPDDAEIEKKGLVVNVAKGAYLQLDFTGTNRVTRFTVDGVKYSGVVNGENCPAVFGAGTLNVVPRDIGAMLIVR